MKKLSPERIEQVLFLLITILNLVPFISVKFFPSLDGASHLANANIIDQIIFRHNDLFRQFFSINPEPVPNWTSHFILALLQLVMPAFLAEKILITGLVAGLPIVFRKLIRRISPDNMLPSYLIFPFTHSLFLFFGFFNFCVAVIFLLVTLDQWLKHENSKITAKSFLLLSALVLLTYFSHILVFGILLLILFLRIPAGFIRNRKDGTGDQPNAYAAFRNKMISLAGISLLPFSLFIYFFVSRPSTQNTTFLPFKELLAYLGDIRPLISFDHGKESILTISLLVLILFLSVYAGVRQLLPRNKPDRNHLNRWWLSLSFLLILLLYFSLPNSYGTASFTNLRLLFLLFMMMILWIAAIKLPVWLSITAAAIAVVLNFFLLLSSYPVIRDYSRIAASCNKAADFIEPNSLVLPLNCSENWFTSHFLDYVAIDKKILLVYNYEAETGYFPVIWNEYRRPGFFTGNFSKQGNYHLFRANKERLVLGVRYIMILGTLTMKDDPFFAKLPRILEEEFSIAYRTDFCTLYKIKEQTKASASPRF